MIVPHATRALIVSRVKPAGIYKLTVKAVLKETFSSKLLIKGTIYAIKSLYSR